MDGANFGSFIPVFHYLEGKSSIWGAGFEVEVLATFGVGQTAGNAGGGEGH